MLFQKLGLTGRQGFACGVLGMVTLNPMLSCARLDTTELPCTLIFSPLLLTQWVVFDSEEVARKLKLMFE